MMSNNSSRSGRSSRSANSDSSSSIRSSNSGTSFLYVKKTPRRTTSPVTVQGQRHSSQSHIPVNTAKEQMEAYDRKIANATARRQQAKAIMEKAEMEERHLAEERERIRNLHRRSVNTQQSGTTGQPPPIIINRAPDETFDCHDNASLYTSRSGDSGASGRSYGSGRSTKGSYKVVGLIRPARPKTIWGGPAWS